MKRKVLSGMITAVFLLSAVLVGCQESGIAPETYNQVVAQLQDAQDYIDEVQNELGDLQAEKEAVEAELEAARAEIDGLLTQISTLQEQYDLVGATKAETAEKIVKYYHDTHEYSVTDLFVCSDMAAEVWNMLKAQGIDAVITVGNINTSISDILLSNHAWVRAEVGPGEYLALEATGGYAVPKSENALYYRGWIFDSPKELKRHNELVREHNVRVDVINLSSARAKEVAEEHKQTSNQTEADKLKAVYDELVELINAQEAKMNEVKAELSGLSTKCGT